MEPISGKLILLNPDGPEQEFELNKASVTIGRAQTNDIVLNEGRISRNHARLELTRRGAKVSDLGSSNGTRLNGLRVEQAEVKPGDVLSLGSSQLRFELALAHDEPGMTMIDDDASLEYTIDHEVLPFSIQETGQPRLVVFTAGKTWELSLDETDLLTIGRTEENGLAIDLPKVSRQHAEVQRKGGIFILKDLGSTNGTWKGVDKVDQLILQDGDVFRIGGAQIVFKNGFQESALTMADEKLAFKSGRRLVVFVPGLMGSELWLGKERVWPNVKTIFRNPEIYRFPSEIPLEPRGIVDEIVIVPNLIKQDQYNRLGDYLVEELGYQRSVDFFEFAYDWRQDVRKSARQLGALIESLPKDRPLVLIGHSLGTMVSRYYIERLGGKERVERVILMGGPHHGVVKALTSLLVAPEVLPFGLMGERLRQIIMTFETSYQIIPTYPLAIDTAGTKVNFLEDETWLPPEYIPNLRLARQFRKELGSHLSIPAVSIFGYGLKTIANVSIQRLPSGAIRKVDYKTTPSGDSTVLEHSAVCEGTDIHPVQQYHGSLFVDNDVKMRLKLELTRPF